jgi:UDP-N-acetylmuramoylalanine--D-glutamate ligase
MNQEKCDYAVLNNEDEGLRECADSVKSRVVYFGSGAKAGAWVNGHYWYKNERLCEVNKSRLKGTHNIMNVLASIAVAKCIGLSSSDIENGLTTFTTLPHRLEEIGTYQGIHYINNSMCTNTRAAIESFKAIKGNKIVIVGGTQKGDRGTAYLELLVNHAKACVILGANAEYIADHFRSKDFKRFVVADGIRDAVEKARTFAQPGDIIFLNPGYASFGYFTNFEERGDAFKDAAKQN